MVFTNIAQSIIKGSSKDNTNLGSFTDFPLQNWKTIMLWWCFHSSFRMPSRSISSRAASHKVYNRLHCTKTTPSMSVTLKIVYLISL